jgi:hypothetical protein
MALVIDAIDLTNRKVKLPTEAFLVDTNIIIDFKDPFGISSVDPRYAITNAEIVQVVQYLKSHHTCFTTISVMMEYYKHIQYNHYIREMIAQKFDANDFKIQRAKNANFKFGWELYLKDLKRLFKRNFQIYNPEIEILDLINTFDGSIVDIGDHILYKYSLIKTMKINSIFSRDKDFYSLPDDFYFITTNKDIIALAQRERKLITP